MPATKTKNFAKAIPVNDQNAPLAILLSTGDSLYLFLIFL